MQPPNQSTGSMVVVVDFITPVVCRIFPDQGSNLSSIVGRFFHQYKEAYFFLINFFYHPIYVGSLDSLTGIETTVSALEMCSL